MSVTMDDRIECWAAKGKTALYVGKLRVYTVPSYMNGERPLALIRGASPKSSC